MASKVQIKDSSPSSYTTTSSRKRSICERIPDFSSFVKPLFSSTSPRRTFLTKCQSKTNALAKAARENLNAVASRAGLCKRMKPENSQQVLTVLGNNNEHAQVCAFHEIEISNFHTDRIKGVFEGNFLRRVSKEERESLIEKLKAFQGESLSPEVLGAIRSGNLSHKFFSHSEWTLQALNAYIQGNLDEMEMSKLFVFDACRELQDFKIHDAENPNDLILLGRGLEFFKFSNEMLMQLKKLDLPTRQFFSFRIPMQSKEEWDRKKADNQANDMYNQYYHFGDYSHISPDTKNNEIQVVVYPPRLQYELNKLKFAKHAVLPECVLGYDSKERMNNPNTRILCVPFRFVSLPKTIHEVTLTEKLGMYNHDHVHGIFDSANVHREIFVDLAQKFQEGKLGEALNDRGTSESYLTAAKNSVPHSAYASDDTEFAAFCETFWNSLQRNIQYDSLVQKSEMYAHILSKEKKWGPKYNISSTSLEEWSHTLTDPDQAQFKRGLDDIQEIISRNVHREVWLDLSQKFKEEWPLGNWFLNSNGIMYLSSPLPTYASDNIGFADFIGFRRTFWKTLSRAPYDSAEQRSQVIAYILGKEKEWGSKYNISLASLEEWSRTSTSSNDKVQSSIEKAKELLASA